MTLQPAVSEVVGYTHFAALAVAKEKNIPSGICIQFPNGGARASIYIDNVETYVIGDCLKPYLPYDVKEKYRRLLTYAEKEQYKCVALATTLRAIEANEANYAKREPLVYQALALAQLENIPVGVRYDPEEGHKWPVLWIELPGVGEVAWHCPAYEPTRTK